MDTSYHSNEVYFVDIFYTSLVFQNFRGLGLQPLLRTYAQLIKPNLILSAANVSKNLTKIFFPKELIFNSMQYIEYKFFYNMARKLLYYLIGVI